MAAPTDSPQHVETKAASDVNQSSFMKRTGKFDKNIDLFTVHGQQNITLL